MAANWPRRVPNQKYDLLIHPNAEDNTYSLIEDSRGIIQGISGAFAMSSILIRIILTTPGSGGDPEEGSSIALMAGSLYDSRRLKPDVLREIQRVERYYKRLQARHGAGSLDETLQSIEVLSVQLIGQEILKIRLLIRSAADSIVRAELSVAGGSEYL